MGERVMRGKNVALRPYSLVEMLVVLAIIAILVGIGAGGYTVARRWLAQSQTEALLAKLKLAIESYKNDKGYYPLPQGVETNFRLDTNVKDYTGTLPSSDDHLQTRNNMNSFMDYSKIQQDQSIKVDEGNYTSYYVKDGWNAPSVTKTISGKEYSWGAIKYECPGTKNKTSFDLYSAGPDRKFASDPEKDKEDDIYAQ